MEEPIEIKPLDINYERICDCPSNHMNCMNAKEWTQSMVAIWEFFYNSKDIRDKDLHPAVFPIGLPKKCIELFTHEGELVVDPFSGSGTTLVAAMQTNRNAVGFDLKKEYVDLANSRLSQVKLEEYSEDKDKLTRQIAVQAEAHDIKKYLNPNTVSLFVTSPPYSNMLNRPRTNKSMRGDKRQDKHYLKVQQYSNDPRDLGTMEPKPYAKALGEIYREMLPLLKPKGHSIINVTDIWSKEKKEGRRIPIHMYVTEEMENAGYELRNIIIWDRRNLVNQIGIFGWPNNYITFGTTFEYILDFWKPPD